MGNERYSNLTVEEEYTHVTFWCIFRSPLMLGGNLPENRPFELSLFSNPEVIAVNQQGENPRELYKKDSAMVWYSHEQASKDLFVALFNLGENSRDVKVSFSEIGFNGRVKIRDLWQKEDIGVFKGGYHRQIPPHGTALLKLSGF